MPERWETYPIHEPRVGLSEIEAFHLVRKQRIAARLAGAEKARGERAEAEAAAGSAYVSELLCVMCNTPVIIACDTLRHSAALRNRGGCAEPYVIGWGLAPEDDEA